MCTSPTFMLCTLVCFAALKFKCICFDFAPFLPLLSPALCALLIFFLAPSLSICICALHSLYLAPFPSHLLFTLYYYCDNSSTCVPLFFFIPSLHMLGIPIVTSSLFLPCALVSSLSLLMASLWLLPSPILIPYLSPSCFFAWKYGSWMAIPALFSLRRH